MQAEITTAEARQLVAAPAERQGDVGLIIRPLLDRVWAFIRTHNLATEHNIIVYRDIEHGVEIVEAGVELPGELPPLSEGLVLSTTPAGHVARTTHTGAYNRLYETSIALRGWCAANGHTLAGMNGKSTATGPKTNLS
jgi:hypothetical protein